MLTNPKKSRQRLTLSNDSKEIEEVIKNQQEDIQCNEVKNDFQQETNENSVVYLSEIKLKSTEALLNIHFVYSS